jgi:ubiquinol-cytochrome c reductase cytochrome b subunit
MRRILAATICSALLTLAATGVFLWSHYVAPMRVIPPWWALPFYAVLRAVPTKLGAIVAALAALFGLFLLPWIVLADARNRLYRPIALLAAVAFVLTVFALGYSGAHLADEAVVSGGPGPFLLDASLNTQLWLGRVATAYYFAYIVVIAPALGWRRRADAAAVFA